MKATIGIDPGITGAVVVLAETAPICAIRTPVFGSGKREFDLPEMARVLEEARTEYELVRVGIEKVGTMPRDGRVGAFNFGRGYGLWLGLLAGMGLSYVEVPPQRWQAKMLAGLPKGPKTKTSAVQRCKSLFPTIDLRVKADWGIADAALIAEYTRQTWNQES